MNIDSYNSGRGYSSRDHHGDHRRDRDRGDRGDRPSGRGGDRDRERDRGGRPDRERPDRDRPDRGDRDRRGDRERPDRGDRGDRGDRHHRERSRSPGHRSSRARAYGDDPAAAAAAAAAAPPMGGRGGGGGGGGGGGDRYRDRTEPDRYSRHMDVDRDYEREHSGRDRERERLSRYDDARRDSAGPRKRSATPPVKKREPTPDLTDVVPISDRKRRLTMWDIKPQGYENVTAEQAKLSGMFPLPGAPRQTPMDPTRLQAFMAQGPANAATVTALKPTNSRQAKRLILANIPAAATEEAIMAFLNAELSHLNVISNQDPVTLVQFSADRRLGMVELRSSEDATVALAFSGIELDGQPLDLRRPKDYIVPLVTDISAAAAAAPRADSNGGQLSSHVPDTPNKIAVSNIPAFLGDEQVIELLKSFGELKAFVLVKDADSDDSRGVAFCEYADPSTTEIAVEGLNGMEIGDRLLRVRLASIGMKQAPGVELGVNAMAMMAGTTSSELEQGRVIQLLNMVTTDELMDADEYDDIRDEIRSECSKYGRVLDMNIPRPTGGSRQSAGLGKIYVRFEDAEAAARALRALAGRKFSDRTVVATYFSEENYEVGAF